MNLRIEVITQGYQIYALQSHCAGYTVRDRDLSLSGSTLRLYMQSISSDMFLQSPPQGSEAAEHPAQCLPAAAEVG